MAIQFRKLVDFSLHIESYGTEHLVYHEGSGATHLLDEFGNAVLQALSSGAMDMNGIIEYCSKLLAIHTDEDFSEHIREVIRQLGKHDLIEMVRFENS